MNKGEEPEQEVGEPGEGAIRAAARHQIDDEIAHVERQVRLHALEDGRIERAGIDAHREIRARAGLDGGGWAPEFSEDRVVGRGLAVGQGAHFIDRTESLGPGARRSERRVNGEGEVAIGHAEPRELVLTVDGGGVGPDLDVSGGDLLDHIGTLEHLPIGNDEGA